MPQLWIEAVTVKIGKLKNLRPKKDLRADQTEFVIMDMNDVEQKNIYKCSVIALMFNHCHLGGEIYFNIYFNVMY